MSNWYTKNLSERVDMRLLGLKTTVLGDKTRIQEGLDRLEQCAKKRKETCGAGEWGGSSDSGLPDSKDCPFPPQRAACVLAMAVSSSVRTNILVTRNVA